MTNIIFTGLRGSGKTTIGYKIAQKLNREFYDIDEEIQIKENKTIKDIVKIYGWEKFRKLEKEICKNLEKTKNSIIALGGGTILDENNYNNLKNIGHIIYLYADPKLCAERIEGDMNRPPLTKEKNIHKEMLDLFIARDKIYRQKCDTVFIRSNEFDNDIKKIIKIINYSS